jgi:O-antigen/teichoic acid export membrane protein
MNTVQESELSRGFEDAAPAAEVARMPKSVGTGALVAAGAIWTVFQTVGTKVILFVNQMALAWLLAPDDFGKIGLAYTVTAFVALLVNPGIDVILVRRGRRFHLWSTPAFYFGLLTAALGCSVILIAAPIAARSYETPELVGVLAVLAFSTPLAALMLVPTAKLRSEMRFKAIAMVVLFQTVLQTVLTIGFAQAGFRVYSFALPMPIVYLSSAALLWAVARPKIKLRNPLRHWKYLIGDSSYILGARVLHTATGQADYIVLGGLYGSSVVGPYFFAYVLAKQAARLSAGSLQLVLTAGLSRLPTHSTQQTLAALRATRSVALLGMPMCMLQAALVDPLLRALYGEKWLAAIPLAQLISIGMAIDVPSWASGTLLEVRGQFRLLFYWWSGFGAVLIVAIVVGAYLGAAWGTAFAVCVLFGICSPLFTIWVFRPAGIGWRELASIYLLPMTVGGLGSATALSMIELLSGNGAHPWVQFGVASVLSGIVTLIGAYVFARGWVNDISAQFRYVLPQIRIFRNDRRDLEQI